MSELETTAREEANSPSPTPPAPPSQHQECPQGGPGPGTAWLIYLALVLAATWPLPLQATTHCWGIRYDLWGNLWLMGYFHQALEKGALHFTTPQIFYPEGFSVWAYGHFVLQILAAPLLSVAPPPLAYAFLVWGAISVSALALYVLAQDQVHNRWAAFVAGGLYAFHGLKYAELAVGSVEQAASFGLPLFILCLIRWREQGGWRWGALAYLAIMLTAMCNWFFGIALASFTVLFVVFHLIGRRERALGLDLRTLGQALLLGGACLLTVQPFLGAVVPEILARPALSGSEWQGSGLSAAQQEDGQDDVPPLLSEVNTDAVSRSALQQTVADSLPLNRLLEDGMTTHPRLAGPGFQIILLGLLGIVLGGRRARFWLFAFVVLTLVSMGPFLRTADTATPQPLLLPYYPIYNAIPIFRVAYRPYRFQSAALVAGCVLAAFGLAAVLRRVRQPRKRAMAAVAILATALFVRWVLCTPDRAPLLSDARPPPFYQQIAAEPGTCALIEIPLHHWMFGSSNARFQYYESLHRKPMLNNSMFINMQQMLRLRTLVQAHPLLLTFAEGQYARQVVPPPSLADDVKWLRSVDFRYLVVHTTFPRDTHHPTGFQEDKEMIQEAFIAFLERLFGPPRQEADALLFDVRKNGPGADGTSLPVSVTLDFPADFERIRHFMMVHAGKPLRWDLDLPDVQRIAFWAMAEPGTTQVLAQVSWAGPSGDYVEKTVTVPLDDAQWARFTITPAMLGLDRMPRLRQFAIMAPEGTTVRLNLSNVQALR